MGVTIRITGMCVMIIEAIMHGLAPMVGMGSRSRCSRMCRSDRQIPGASP